MKIKQRSSKSARSGSELCSRGIHKWEQHFWDRDEEYCPYCCRFREKITGKERQASTEFALDDTRSKDVNPV